jgi:hypothetical protein
LFITKTPTHYRDSNPGPLVLQSGPQTTRPAGRLYSFISVNEIPLGANGVRLFQMLNIRALKHHFREGNTVCSASNFLSKPLRAIHSFLYMSGATGINKYILDIIIQSRVVSRTKSSFLPGMS